jgi:hypothetical protein
VADDVEHGNLLGQDSGHDDCAMPAGASELRLS